MDIIEQQNYHRLKVVFDELIKRHPRIEISLSIKKDGDTDTEIFIRKGFAIFSFRVAHDGTYFDRWAHGRKKHFQNDDELIDYIKELLK